MQIEQLSFGDAFVRTLPGDPRTDNRTREVLGACYSRVQPTPVPRPELLVLVPEVAALLGLEASPALTEVLAGNRVLPGMAPYAACYGGHQFGTWAGQLGDGRAITLGEITQASGAFVLVVGAFGWVVDNYQRLADWLSSVNRVARLMLALDAADAAGTEKIGAARGTS